MGFKCYQVANKDICIMMGWGTIDIPSLWLCMLEEVGELAASVRRFTKVYPDHKKMNIRGELMDVLSYVLQLADKYDVDLETGWDSHLNAHRSLIV
jgi:NTP pyrophosphatase (non-canonical NTP hydrolase)